jgi:hypothetical protein
VGSRVETGSNHSACLWGLVGADAVLRSGSFGWPSRGSCGWSAYRELGGLVEQVGLADIAEGGFGVIAGRRDW